MKILLVAFACHPEWGSESAAGWGSASLLAQKHNVHVVTHTENRNGIQIATKNKKYEGSLKLTYVGEPFKCHPNRMVARINSWRIYKKWLDQVEQEMPEILRSEQYDFIHHVTIATWRIAAPWYRFGLPTIFGPVGGTASYPWKLMGMLSAIGALFESIRNLGNSISCHMPNIVASCRRTSAIICGNREAGEFLLRIRKRKTGIHILSSAHFSGEDISRFSKDLAAKNYQGTLNAFAGGICIGSKGIHFALQALRVARDQGSIIQYTIASTGPELEYLKKQTKRLGLENQVDFHNGFQHEAYRKALWQSQIFLLPSFREGSPRTILEAMLSGAVPVVVKASAQGDIATAEVGFAVPCGGIEIIINGLAQALITLDRNRDLLKKMSSAAQIQVAKGYSTSRYLEKLEHIYSTAIKNQNAESHAREYPL